MTPLLVPRLCSFLFFSVFLASSHPRARGLTKKTLSVLSAQADYVKLTGRREDVIATHFTPRRMTHASCNVLCYIQYFVRALLQPSHLTLYCTEGHLESSKLHPTSEGKYIESFFVKYLFWNLSLSARVLNVLFFSSIDFLVYTVETSLHLCSVSTASHVRKYSLFVFCILVSCCHWSHVLLSISPCSYPCSRRCPGHCRSRCTRTEQEWYARVMHLFRVPCGTFFLITLFYRPGSFSCLSQ